MKTPNSILLTACLIAFWGCNLLSQDQKNTDSKPLINPTEVGIFDTDLLPASFHKERRQKLRELMSDNSVAVLFSSPIRNRSNDVDYEYHQDPNFYYLTGLREPHSVVLIYKNEVEIEGKKTNEVIFVQPRNQNKELWLGKRMGVAGVSQLLEFENVYPNTAFSTVDCLFDKMVTTYLIRDKGDTRDTPDEADLFDLKKSFETRRKKQASSMELINYLAQLREIKTEEELVLMRKAIDITCKAQIELMKSLNPQMAEYQSEALVEFHFRNEGAEHAGFPSIHGSGGNSCILHYVSNRRMFEENDLLVSDIGAEYHGYTADVTRTLPVNGKYTKEQAIIYNLVLKAQIAGIDSCLSGKRFTIAGEIANDIIAQGLLELGIIKNKSDVRQYFPHGTSHYLGLDVHDLGTFGKLKPGQVITVEPGIYIPSGSDCDPKWWNIGVRIEDDILITNSAPQNLSDCVPRTIDEIEKRMKNKE